MTAILRQSHSFVQSTPGFVVFALLTIICAGTLDSLVLTANAHPTSFWSRQANTLCSNPPRDTCNFYADCLETKYQCGPEGYPIGFGQKFCEKFSASRAELSEKGQTWMLDTMQCLQKELVPEATSSVGVTCDSLEKKAFASHGKCYVENGLCTLPISDLAKIVGIVEFKNLFDSKESFLATLDAGTGCVKAYLFFLKNLIF